MNNTLNTHLARAIRKYKPNNFIIELIETVDNQETLTLREHYWINFYDSVKNGYNETNDMNKSGGNTYKVKTSSEMEVIKHKISISKQGSRNNNAKEVKCFNVITKEELYFDTIKDCKEYFNEKHHRFITVRVNKQTKMLYKKEWLISYKNDEYIQDYTTVKPKTGIKIKVIDIDNGNVIIFNSIREASRTLNIVRYMFKNDFIYNNLIIKILK